MQSNDSAGNVFKGVGLALIAYMLFDSMGAVVKHIGIVYPAVELSFFRNVIGLIPSAVVLATSRDWHAAGCSFRLRHWKLALLRGLFAATAQYCFYTSLVHLEFATAVTLSFIGPVLVTTLSVPLLKAHVGIWRWAAVAIGFIGVVIVMRPGSDVFTLYSVLPLGAACCYALSAVSVRLVDDDVPNALINLYSITGAVVVSFIYMTASGDYRPVASAHDWMWIAVMGGFGGVAVLFLISGYRATAPINIAPFEYFGIPFSFTLGWLIFDESPIDRLFPGVLLIVAAGFIIIWRERVHRRKPPTVPLPQLPTSQ